MLKSLRSFTLFVAVAGILGLVCACRAVPRSALVSGGNPTDANAGAPASTSPEANAATTTVEAASVNGSVVSVDAATGKVIVETVPQRDAPRRQVTVTTDAKSHVTIDGAEDAVANLKPGMIVTVELKAGVAGKIEAVTVVPPAMPLRGTISSVDLATGRISIAAEANPAAAAHQVSVRANARTAIKVNGALSPLRDLKAGMSVKVSPTGGIAARVEAYTRPPEAPLRGRVRGVDAYNGYVVVNGETKGVADGRVVRVATDFNTLVFIDEKAGKIQDLKPGMLIEVDPPDGTATCIDALTFVPSVILRAPQR